MHANIYVYKYASRSNPKFLTDSFVAKTSRMTRNRHKIKRTSSGYCSTVEYLVPTSSDEIIYIMQ